MVSPYTLLGVSSSASADEIRRAYRALAKKCHPDLNPGDKAAEQKFKQISVAYDILSDPAKRARFDRGEIDGEGREQAAHFRSSSRRGNNGGAAGFNPNFDSEAFSSIFEELFKNRGATGGAGFHPQTPPPPKGNMDITVDFLVAANGGSQRVQLENGKIVDVAIRAGIAEGDVLRLRADNAPILMTVHIKPHPTFRREGFDIHTDLNISLPEAILGARVVVDTIDGSVAMTLPKHTNGGKVMRIKGKGVHKPTGGRGDHFVTTRVMLPQAIDSELETFIRTWATKHPYETRTTPTTA